MPHISVVIPVYKAEGCLEELYRRLKASLETLTADFEIILVEDCGGDRSWPMILDLARRDARVKGIQFSRNFGQHYGITAGLDHCDGDWVVVMDCDLQDRPEEIPRLYAAALEGYDVVLARRGRRNDPLLKRFTSWLFYKIFSYLADMDYDGETGNFRIVSRKVVQSFRTMRERIDHPDATPSAQVLAGAREHGGFFSYAMQLAQQHTRGLQAQTLDAAANERFAATAPASLRAQQQLEAAEQGSFEDFVAGYYA
jgi:glycosyltransferase involved in cell wall biosynthesis